jgi:hypothetical protein
LFGDRWHSLYLARLTCGWQSWKWKRCSNEESNGFHSDCF